MTSFDERENAFEAEFAHGEELKFKVRECALALLARWAAQRLGKTGEATETYVREIAASDVADPRRDATFEHVAADLASVGVTQQDVRHAMEQFLAQAAASMQASA